MCICLGIQTKTVADMLWNVPNAMVVVAYLMFIWVDPK